MSEQVRELPAPRTPVARFIGVITSPGETFQEISRQPGWLVPFVVYLAVFLVGFGVYAAKADWISIISEQIESNPIMKLVPDANRDQAVAKATEDFRRLSPGELLATNLINAGSGQLPFHHFMVLFISTLFVMMGSLKDLKLGRAWGNFLLCVLTFIGYLVVYGIARFTFHDSPASELLLTGTGAVIMVGVWAWLLNGLARRDVEFHRMLSVYMYSTVIVMISVVALMVASLAHQGPIQVYVDKMVPSNLGALLKPDNAVLRALLGSLDVFWIWFLVVLTIGFRTVTKLSTGMAASMTFLPWGLFVMIKLAWAAVFG